MLEMQNIDHVGIRISDRDTSVAFYELLGFELVADAGFDHGHPLVLVHPSGITRAEAMITLVNLAYHMKRLVFQERRATTA